MRDRRLHRLDALRRMRDLGEERARMLLAKAHHDERAAADAFEECGEELRRLDALATDSIHHGGLLDITRQGYLMECAADQAGYQDEMGEQHDLSVAVVEASTRDLTDAWKHLEASQRRLDRHQEELLRRNESILAAELADLWLWRKKAASHD